MSQENVEIVRGHIEAFRAEDAPRAVSFLDPHIVLDVSRTGGIDSAFYGHQAIAEFVRRYAGTFEDYRYEVERLTDLGSGAVLAVLTETGRGKGSGVPVDRSLATLYTVIDGRIARITTFRTEQEAHEAAGLREQAMSGENVEIVRQALDDVVLRTAEGWPEPIMEGSRRGPLRGLCGNGGRDVVSEDLIDAGESVVLQGRAHMTGERSGLEGDMQFIQVLTFQKGKVVLVEFFWDHQEALEAAGLRGQVVSQENLETLQRGRSLR